MAAADRSHTNVRRWSRRVVVSVVLAVTASLFAPMPRFPLARASYTAADLLYNPELVYLFFHNAITYETLARYWVGSPPSENEIERRKRIFHELVGGYAISGKAVHSGTTYSFASITPTLPFVGNQSIAVDPLIPDGTDFAGVVFARKPDCSLSALVFEPVAHVLDPTSMQELTNAQDALHAQSGFTTTADRFPSGCVDSPYGKRSASLSPLQPVGVVGTRAMVATIDSMSEVLRLQVQDTATHVTSSMALTTGRVTSLAVADVNGDGLNDIVASGVGASSTSSGHLVVFVNNGDGTFRTTTDVGAPQTAFVIDDVNGDASVDIVMPAGFDSSGTGLPGVLTFLGNGDGTFRSPVTSATSVARADGPFVTGDFNGDGKTDLLLDTLVLLGNGDGTFTAGPALPSSIGFVGFNAAVGDVDRDGKLDIAYTSIAGFVQVLLGNGDGTFRIGARYAAPASAGPVSITEIDGDGNPDLVVGVVRQGLILPSSNDALALRTQFLLGRGDGTFVGAPVASSGYTTNSSAPQTALADFDGDGRLDALVADAAADGTLSVLRGDGRAGFGNAIRSATSVRAQMLASTDLDGDAKPDAVVAGFTIPAATPVVATLTNVGNGTFSSEHDYALPSAPIALAVGDFNGDGRVDVAVATSTLVSGGTGPGVYVLFGQPGGTLSAPVRIDASTNAVSIAAIDLNGDGRADLVVADQGTSLGAVGGLYAYLGNADGTFAAAAVPATTATRYSAVAFADMNRDGKVDLVAAGSVPGSGFGVIAANVYTFPGRGDGTFGAPTVETLSGNDGSASAIAIADFDKDGALDIAVGTQNDFTEVLLGKGDGTYAHGLLTLAEHPSSLVAGDLDNDGYPDLLAGVGGNGTIVLRNVGTAAAWGAKGATTPVADFTVSATPAAATVTAGQSVQTIVAVMPANGFTQTVTFACSGLPAGATCSFSPASVTPAGSAASSTSLTIATATRTASLGFERGGPPTPQPGGDLPAGVLVAALGAAACSCPVGASAGSAASRCCWSPAR